MENNTATKKQAAKIAAVGWKKNLLRTAVTPIH
jgi:hypothetical protein